MIHEAARSKRRASQSAALANAVGKCGYESFPISPSQSNPRKPDWARAKYIENLGKCRMHIVCAAIHHEGIGPISKKHLRKASLFAHFSMTGEIEDET